MVFPVVRRVAIPCLLAALVAVTSTATAQQIQWGGDATTSGLQELARFAASQYQRIESGSRAALANERGYGTCDMRAEALQLALPDAARLADLNRDLYFHPYDGQMWQKGVTIDSAEIQPGLRITVYRDPASDGYAELYPPLNGHAAVLIFRGTQITSANDIMANIAQFTGSIPPKYIWAASLAAQAARELNGAPLILSGHSLGGGLAMYAGLKNRLPAVTFNPAGLSRAAFNGLSDSDIIQAGERTTTYISRSGSNVDPVAALSLAGDSIILGQRYVIDLGSLASPLQIHDVGVLANQLQKMEKSAASLPPDQLCDLDLGARPVQ